MFFSNTNTGVVVYHYELEDDTSDFTIAIEHGPDESTTSGAHCAWCGDPPDRHGSHGICTFHAAQLVKQAAARRRSRG
jgi:hypothetical protein